VSTATEPQGIARNERRVLIPQEVEPPPFAGDLRILIVKHLAGETMGTSWSVRLAVAPGTDLTPIQTGIEAVFSRIVDEMSTWVPSSHISRFNAAPVGSIHHLPDGFFRVLSAALDWAARMDGAYDPTLGASVDLWGFGPGGAEKPGAIPEDAAVCSARDRSGWQRVVLDRTARMVSQPGGLALDLSSIAKGFAVDEVSRFLARLGIASHLVEIGGELRGEGLKPDGTPWWIELEKPRETAVLGDMLLALVGCSVATSGDERRYFDLSGKRYSHTLDPRTGAPVAHNLLSVTVVARDCMTADALATALLVMGPEKGPEFAEANDVAARFVRGSGARLAEQLSPVMAAMLD
jgi:thiamine biosynthesis lipoprotein